MLIAGILTAAAVIIVLLKLRRGILRRVLGYDIFLDIGITASMAVIFYGTYSGMMAAIIGGLVFSVAVHIIKMCVGSEILAYKNKEFVWVKA